jgi:hypothetical protein
LHKVLLFDTSCIYLHLDRKSLPAYRQICSWGFFKT